VTAPLARLRHFTDPGCPFAFSAERQRMRLRWLFGDQLAWETHMVVLSEEASYDEALAERLASGMHRLAREYGMPIDWSPRRHTAPTVHACRAVVAVRLRWPEAEDAFLRHLRVLGMGGELLDDSDTLEIAAERAGLPVAELAAFAAEPEVQAALEADMEVARRPSAAAEAMDERLGGPADERRYTCPSYEIERIAAADGNGGGASRIDLPGFRPFEAYLTALANVAPELERRDDPAGPLAVLDWAPYPLATAEIAMVCDADVDDVRAELARSGARFEPVGGDGYWSS
jgi:2-hydroxychromene-2-carboxylate isomerase